MSIYTMGIVVLTFIAIVGMILGSVKETSNNVKATTSQVMQMNELADKKEELKEIKKLIKIKQQELENLVYATEQAKRRTVTNLTLEQEEAIDKYESMGIRLPIDIIEELSYSNNVTYNSAMSFIESQRKVWKAQFSITMTKGMM
ncbi:hypothetical protein STITCH_36 [Bacillus phage Stitch]|uniref:Early protein n=1 Tax=Bacillus phage Stitch TaxID=1874002 RepID=A0A1B1PAP5_9CAUD|nr:GP16.7-like replication protein [Bacillus phage Stitch]ANT41233.1 hypothetical protein STITCH_36 [Bacillus phage Stitch]